MSLDDVDGVRATSLIFGKSTTTTTTTTTAQPEEEVRSWMYDFQIENSEKISIEVNVNIECLKSDEWSFCSLQLLP